MSFSSDSVLQGGENTRDRMMRLSTVECDHSGSWMGLFRWLGEREDLDEHAFTVR